MSETAVLQHKKSVKMKVKLVEYMFLTGDNHGSFQVDNSHSLKEKSSELEENF